MGRAEGRRQVGLEDRIRASGLRFGVTGATGWLGRAATEVIAGALGDDAGARLAPFASVEREIVTDGGMVLTARPLGALPGCAVDVLLHFAYVTREFAQERGVTEYTAANIGITADVVSAIRAHPPRFIGYASSGAATVAEAGHLDAAADPYGTLKVLDELVMRRAAADADARSLVVRVFNVAGPWMRKPAAFALGNLIQQATTGDVMTIRARHAVVRSFVDVEDLARVMIAAALDDSVGDDLQVETVGDEEIEVGDLAVRVRAALGLGPAEIDRDIDPDAPADVYVGSGGGFASLARGLGITLRSLDDQIVRTATGLGLAPASR